MRAWWAVAAITFAGCGRFHFDSTGDAPAGFGDVMATVVGVTVRTDGVDRAGIPILIHDAGGTLVARDVSTGSKQLLAVPIDGMVSTVVPRIGPPDGLRISTIGGVEPGDDLVIDSDDGVSNDPTIGITLPAFGGATSYLVTGPCGSVALGGVTGTLTYVPSCTASSTFRILAIARTGLAVLAWTVSPNLNPGTTNVLLPAWQTTFTNVTANAGTTPTWSDKHYFDAIPILPGVENDGLSFPSESAITGGAGSSLMLGVPTALATDWLYSNQFTSGNVLFYGEIVRPAAPPTTINVGPRLGDVTNIAATGTAPRMGVSANFPAGIDAILVNAAWSAATNVEWLAIYPPQTTSITFFELPADLAMHEPATFTVVFTVGFDSSAFSGYDVPRATLFLSSAQPILTPPVGGTVRYTACAI